MVELQMMAAVVVDGVVPIHAVVVIQIGSSHTNRYCGSTSHFQESYLVIFNQDIV